jgi:4-aminobutyrate aminotransferase-like enzyme
VGCNQNLMGPACEFVHTVDFHMRQSRGAQSVFAQRVMTESENNCLNEIKLLLKEHPITIAVIETVTAGTIEQLGYVFLLQLQDTLSRNKTILIVDDTMMSVRCGRYFSHQLFPGFQPDLVMVGKHWGVSMLISFMDDEMTNMHIPLIAGTLTCQISPLALRKAVHIVTLMVEYALDKSCQRIEGLFLEVLRTSADRVGGAFLNCMGAIASTNLRMRSEETSESILYNRLIPQFTVPLDLLRERIQPDGGLCVVDFLGVNNDDDDDNSDGDGTAWQ